MKFKSETYPQLRVLLGGGKHVKFADGELETTDKAAIEALKALPKDMGVKAVGGRPSKSDDDDNADDE